MCVYIALGTDHTLSISVYDSRSDAISEGIFNLMCHQKVLFKNQQIEKYFLKNRGKLPVQKSI